MSVYLVVLNCNFLGVVLNENFQLSQKMRKELLDTRVFACREGCRSFDSESEVCRLSKTGAYNICVLSRPRWFLGLGVENLLGVEFKLHLQKASGRFIS